MQDADGAVECDCATIYRPCAKGHIGAVSNLHAGTSPVWLIGCGYYDSGSHGGRKVFHSLCGQWPDTRPNIHQEEETPQIPFPASNILKPVRSCDQGSSAGHAVEYL